MAQAPVIPVYGVVEGDTMGLVVLGRLDETVSAVAARLVASASLRIGLRGPSRVLVFLNGRGEPLAADATLRAAGVGPLSLMNVRFGS